MPFGNSGRGDRDSYIRAITANALRCYRQVDLETDLARIRVTYPPSAILARFARKKAASMTKKKAATEPAANMLQPQTSRIAMKSSADVISIVSDTAMP